MNETNYVAPVVPETLDGWSALHELYCIDWSRWNHLSETDRQSILDEGIKALTHLSKPSKGHTAFFAMLGHKADLMILHFRETFDDLEQAKLDLRKLKLFNFLIPTTSYVSFVELGMYEMTIKIYEELVAKNIIQESEEWKAAWKERLDDQHKRMGSRTFCEVPNKRYVCFYPMNKKRGEINNWYNVPMEERQIMMREHGLIGRKYAGQITQIISGSIGTDDWEWGVDLFADDPRVFKKLIYEMRFDKASALYAEFGPFYTGVQFKIAELHQLMSHQTPAL